MSNVFPIKKKLSSWFFLRFHMWNFTAIFWFLNFFSLFFTFEQVNFSFPTKLPNECIRFLPIRTLNELYFFSENAIANSLKYNGVYNCDFCSKTMKNRTNMMGHRRVHTGEKPFACPVCYSAFAQKSNLKAHYFGCCMKNGVPHDQSRL